MNNEKPEMPWERVELKEPSHGFDERISRLIAAAEIHRSISRRGIPAWIVVVACSVCLLLGFWGSRLTPDRPGQQVGEPAVVIEISPEELPPGFFVSTSGHKTPFFERQLFDVEIEVPKGNGGASL